MTRPDGRPTGLTDLLPDLPAALCVQVGMPELWHPAKGFDGADAKAICGRCPEREACLEYALDNDVAGIWGGLSHDQRKQLRRSLGRPHLSTALTAWTPVEPRDVDRAKCGTEGGHKRHRRNGEKPCADCREASTKARRERKDNAA